METEDLVNIILNKLQEISASHQICKDLIRSQSDKIKRLEGIVETNDNIISDLREDSVIYKEANEKLKKQIKK